MPGFDGLRVLSFESRRAKEIAQLISNNGGVPTVAPSTREVAEGPSDEEKKLIQGIVAREFYAVIFMTGVGARALIATAEGIVGRDQFLKALSETRVVVRGPKPAAVMREMKVPVALAVPEPNTWREVVQALEGNPGTVPLAGRRVAVQEHGEPSPQLYDALRQLGAEVFPVHVYRWALPEDTGPLKAAIQSLTQDEIDVVMFTSSVQLAHALQVAEQMRLRGQFIEALQKVVVASIGPTTGETLERHGIRVDIEPSHPKMGFLVEEAAEKSAALKQRKALLLSKNKGRTLVRPG